MVKNLVDGRGQVITDSEIISEWIPVGHAPREGNAFVSTMDCGFAGDFGQHGFDREAKLDFDCCAVAFARFPASPIIPP